MKLPGGVLLAIIEGVAALLMRPSKRKKGRVAKHLVTSLLQQNTQKLRKDVKHSVKKQSLKVCLLKLFSQGFLMLFAVLIVSFSQSV